MSIEEQAKNTLLIEGSAIIELAKHIDRTFVSAVKFIFEIKGRVITSGVGKSGHIARKVAATLASTGTPSFFVDPVECMHGDFGMITKEDCMILYSKSGEVSEMSNMVNWLGRQSIPYIAITNEINSFLAKHAKYTLLIHVEKEACPLNISPTTSSTVSLALSDAIATSLMDLRGFTKSDYAVFHPGGSLGKQVTTVANIMHKTDLPIVSKNITLKEALPVMVEHKLGLVLVSDNGLLEGIIVDGDFKRILLDKDKSENILDIKVSDIMTTHPVTISNDALIGDALAKMEGKITSLIVVEHTEKGDKPLGILHIHDILKYKAI